MSFAIGNVAAHQSLPAATDESAEHLAPSDMPQPPPIRLATESGMPAPPPIKVGTPSPPPIKVGTESGVPTPPPIRALTEVSAPNPPPIKLSASSMPNPPPITVGMPSPPPIRLAPDGPPIMPGTESSQPMPPPIKEGMPTPPPIRLSTESSQPTPPPIKTSTDDALVRQGIIIIGGDIPLHPAVAPAVAAVGDAGAAAVKGLGDALHTVLDGPVVGTGPKPVTEGGGFSGFLHTIANLGRG